MMTSMKRGRKKQPKPDVKFIRHRFDAALALQGRSLREMSMKTRWCARHIALVVEGEREGSAALLETLRAELGEQGWLFATGQSDALADPGERAAA